MARCAVAFAMHRALLQAATLYPGCAGLPEEVGVVHAARMPLRYVVYFASSSYEP